MELIICFVGIYLHNEKNLLKMTLYFGNLTKYEISDFKVMYSGNSGDKLVIFHFNINIFYKLVNGSHYFTYIYPNYIVFIRHLNLFLIFHEYIYINN